jgi:L-alanine-DL-glutamate epimerase-like enolase superfamily enzyme
MGMVTAASPFPVMADESAREAEDVYRLAEARACHLVNIKLAKCGGLRAARRMARAAEEAGLGVMVGTMMETASGVSASAVLAAYVAPAHVHDLDAAWWARPEEPVHYRPPLVLYEGASDIPGGPPGPAADVIGGPSLA